MGGSTALQLRVAEEFFSLRFSALILPVAEWRGPETQSLFDGCKGSGSGTDWKDEMEEYVLVKEEWVEEEEENTATLSIDDGAKPEQSLIEGDLEVVAPAEALVALGAGALRREALEGDEDLLPGPPAVIAQQHESRPVLVIREVPPMPPIGETPYRVPGVPGSSATLKKLQKILDGKIDRRHRGAGRVGHCVIDYFMAPSGREWRCLDCFIFAEGWTLRRTHVVGTFQALSTPACKCGRNPHSITRVDLCQSCSYIFIMHREDIMGGSVFDSITTN